MPLALGVASLAWLVLLAAAVIWPLSQTFIWPGTVYAFASFVCHQLPERSFQWGSTVWPVCARCLGLYTAAPLGALAAVLLAARPNIEPARNLWLLAGVAAPSAITWVAEFVFSVPVSNEARFVAALPLGAGVAWVLTRTLQSDRNRRVSQYTLSDVPGNPRR